MKKQKFSEERHMLITSSYTLAAFILISAIYYFLPSNYRLLSTNYMIKNSQYAIYLILTAILSAGLMHYIYDYYKSMSCMIGMMVGMTVGMISGLMVGYHISLTNGMFTGTVSGMLVGILVGVVAGRLSGIMAVMEGFMAGVMGGQMGSMLGTMMRYENLTVFNPFLFVIYAALIVGFVYLVYTETRKYSIEAESHPDNIERIERHKLPFVICTVAIALILFWVIAYGPRSGFLI
ncbi:hypothetical protein HYU06_02285 [Candidatus Woesearchaeota archaeon]|nr:hypothetical protein [Candidatus Woesearchaeota archaeon]